MTSIRVHEPGNDAPELAIGPGGFDTQRFMGTWCVLWSTLPMWKDKRDVTITYTPTTTSSTFESIVEYFKPGSSTPSTVKGTETLTPGANGATFNWRGKGWLFFVSSHWEILGYGEESGVEWLVSYFSKTLFTPAGLDIYVRKHGDRDVDAVISKVVEALQGVRGVSELASSGFRVAQA
ncbi:hypothetical protein Q5752_003594 [Cryptotrichosporon argae]